MKNFTGPQLAIRYGVSRTTISNWIRDGKFNIHPGMRGLDPYKIGKVWQVAGCAVIAYERKVMMNYDAIPIIFMSAAMRVMIEDDEDVLETVLLMLAEEGGTIVVNHNTPLARFFGLSRKATLDYGRVIELIENGTLIIWHKDNFYGEHYRVAPKGGMLL